MFPEKRNRLTGNHHFLCLNEIFHELSQIDIHSHFTRRKREGNLQVRQHGSLTNCEWRWWVSSPPLFWCVYRIWDDFSHSVQFKFMYDSVELTICDLFVCFFPNQLIKNLPAMQETRFHSWVGKIPQRRDKATYSSIHGLPWCVRW